MKHLLKDNRYFFIGYFIFLLTAVILLLSFSKPQLHIFSNEANSPFFDLFFKYTTYFGDGAMIAVLFIVLLFVKYRFALVFLSGSMATAFVVNIFKKLVFQDMFRPSKYFELFETYQLHFVEGVKLHALQSFPSGHTATAFNVFLTLALIVNSKSLKLFFFVCSVLVAYSRVYLSQHFLIDITVGSFIGTTLIVIFWLWFEKFNKTWLDKSVLNR